MQVAQGHGWSGWRGEKRQQQKKRRHSLPESEREPQMGREGRDESDRGGGGKAVTLASSPTPSSPHPPPPRRQAALAVLCSGEERLLKPGPGLHVWTQSLALPLQTNGAECKPAVAAAPSSSSPRDS